MPKSKVATVLREELAQRKKRNPRYSLRSFAQFLGLSPAFLSKILSGKKSLSGENFLRIAEKLKLSDEVMDGFLEEYGPDSVPQENFVRLEEDRFRSIRDWYHFAILEAVQLHDYQNRTSWLAEKLQIPLQTATEAVERLARLGFLDLDAKGRVLSTPKNYTTFGQTGPSEAVTERERQLLKKALHALDHVPLGQRSQTSLTMAIPKSRYKKAVDLIVKFHSQMGALSEVRGKKDVVYNLCVSFYPLTVLSEEL